MPGRELDCCPGITCFCFSRACNSESSQRLALKTRLAATDGFTSCAVRSARLSCSLLAGVVRGLDDELLKLSRQRPSPSFDVMVQGVQWIVMSEPVTMGKMQLDEFRTSVALFHDSKVPTEPSFAKYFTCASKQSQSFRGLSFRRVDQIALCRHIQMEWRNRKYQTRLLPKTSAVLGFCCVGTTVSVRVLR